MPETKKISALTMESARNRDLSVLYVSTFPPRKCGIATFTQDLTNAIDDMFAPAIKSKIMAINPADLSRYTYPPKVLLQITQNKEEDYRNAAHDINQMKDVQLVNIQHEFGIFGGPRGSYLIPFLQELKKPAVINFHTVLPGPDEELHNVVCALSQAVIAITVMTDLSKKILIQDYGISTRKIRVIPHGIHSQSYTSSRQAKTALGFSDRVVFSTFGLLNPGKGIEYVIEALPAVKKNYPNFVYIYFGATHPTILQGEGEVYRNSLIDQVYRLGLFEHVRFYNRFLPLNELMRFLKATDVYISPGLDPNQAVSGTLSYALGTGRPVISTAFANARELITDDVGLLVDFRNSEAYTEAMLRLIEDEELRTQMGKNAYFRTRFMIWPNVALKCGNLFAEKAKSLADISESKILPKIKLDHMIRLTDNFGIVQFAKLSRPDRSFGYTLDDNARALTAMVLYYDKLKRPSKNSAAARQRKMLLKLINIYLNFIEFTLGPDISFLNYVKRNRKIDEELNQKINHEEANGRAIYALALTMTTGILPESIRERAMSLLEKRFKGDMSFQSPRAIALFIKALCLLLEKKLNLGEFNIGKTMAIHCDRLISLYNKSSSRDWQWFEEYFTYSNASLSESLIRAHQITKDERYLAIGKATLDFLILHCFIDDIYVPIGEEGWYYKYGKRNHYDQQPEDVRSMVNAMKTCYIVTRDKEYLRLMHRAFNWFLGDNTLNQVVYDRTTGGCYDGVGRNAINLNQGAESTVSYLLARLDFE